MSKIQNAIKESIKQGAPARITVTHSEMVDLLAIASDVDLMEGVRVDAWGTQDGLPWHIEARPDIIAALAAEPLAGAYILPTYQQGDCAITIRPNGAHDSSGDATVLMDDERRLWLLEGDTRHPFFGELQDIVDAWDHA